MGRILQERIGASRPLPPGEEVLLSLSLAAADAGASVQAVLRRHGLGHRQYNVLRMLRGAGSAGRSHTEIGDRLLVRSPDVTRLMDRLVEAGWVHRERSPTDGRVVLHRLTDAGRGLLDAVAVPLAEVHGRLLDLLGGDATHLVTLCERVIDGAASGALAPREQVGAAGHGLDNTPDRSAAEGPAS